jgi:hypothetical protein
MWQRLPQPYHFSTAGLKLFIWKCWIAVRVLCLFLFEDFQRIGCWKVLHRSLMLEGETKSTAIVVMVF